MAAIAVLTLLMVPAAPASADPGRPSTHGPSSALPPVNGQWDKPGPFQVATKGEADTTLYYPRDIATSEYRHPVIIWGNGTFAFPLIYDGLLRHWASHGFVVAAANTPFSNTGLEMRAGIDLLAKANAQSGSPFHGRIDLGHIGAAGHSQGGAGAINAAMDPRVTTTVPIQPGPLALPSSVRSPALYLAGQKDMVVFPALVQLLYDRTTQVPAVYAELAGAGHLTAIGNAGGFRGLTTAWLRFHLLGDEQARGVFFGSACGICSGSTWPNVKRNAKALQIPGSTSQRATG
ncbi:hypothetical protein GCM10010411_15840 [Actinomadura fulvescens]|uniref:poly(ethylene terephthalate) hydrolase n=1 Tax=Actinomadura fulvescens TaxID=46160 RepID=A0ABP6BUZ4_9ACTN